ncbi:MAG: C40 family peptidase [Candidatus Eremiobacteraeota bacterium]|nr:C40 family peptidase [Candidatus Eremiobacteraeota bacterium]
MHRSIVTGFVVCFLSAGLPAVASATETSEHGAPVATTVTSAAVIDAAEAAAPTAGADLSMWNASPSAAEDAPAAVAPARATRLMHVQKFASGIASRGAAMASSLTRHAMRFLGVPYSFGGTSAYGFDCSGYVQHVFALMGRSLPRTADAQYVAGQSFAGQPQAGDLVFFHTYERGVSHVGIALGNDRFVHASSSHGVMVSTLHDSYWGARYLGAKRIVN